MHARLDCVPLRRQMDVYAPHFTVDAGLSRLADTATQSLDSAHVISCRSKTVPAGSCNCLLRNGLRLTPVFQTLLDRPSSPSHTAISRPFDRKTDFRVEQLRMESEAHA